jgi:hypothetical protein
LRKVFSFIKVFGLNLYFGLFAILATLDELLIDHVNNQPSMIKCTPGVICLFLLSISLHSIAQNVSVSWGPQGKAKKSMWTYDEAGHDATGAYFVSMTENRNWYLEKFDLNHNLIFSNELIMPKQWKNQFKFEKLYYFNGRLVMLTTQFVKDDHKTYAYLSTVTTEGVVNDDMKKVDEVGAEHRWNPGEFNFIVTGDGRKILEYHNDPYRADIITLVGLYERGSNERFSINILDNNFSLVWKKNILLPMEDITKETHGKNFPIENYFACKGDRMYLIGGKDTSNEGKEYLKRVEKYTLYSFIENKGEGREMIINTGKYYIRWPAIGIGNDNFPVCTGLCTIKTTADNTASGTFFIKINPDNGTVVTGNFFKYDKAVGEMLYAPNRGTINIDQRSKSAKEAGDYFDYSRVCRLMLRDDGGFVLTAEQYMAMGSGNPNEKIPNSYEHNDATIISFKNTGDLDWICVIPKFQSSKGGNSAYVVKDKVYMIYADDKKNVNITDPRKLRDAANLVPMVAVIDAKGNYQKNQFALDKNPDEMIIKYLDYTPSPNKSEVISYYDRKVFMGTLTFE